MGLRLAVLSALWLADCSVQSSVRMERGLAEMDITTIGIALGVVITGLYVILGAYFKRAFELNHTVLIFLAVFSLPGGIALIIAGMNGKISDLPSSWREHVTVAGIVAIGLAVHYVFGAFRDCWATQKKSAPEESRESQESS